MVLSSLGLLRSVLAAGIAVIGVTSLTASEKGTPMNYGEAINFLAKYTKTIELKGDNGARVAVTPEFQGRVMTSSCDGPGGISFGFIKDDYIAEVAKNPEKLNKHFNNYGGEERLWLSPEGGPFSLWFKPGVEKQTLDDWFTPPAFNEGAWNVVHGENKAEVRMAAHMKLQNTAGTDFNLDVIRAVHLLKDKDLAQLFGQDAAGKMTGKDVKIVAYETNNQLTNRGPAMTKEKGLVSMWILGMINSGPETVIVVPYKQGSEADLGYVVKSDYFPPAPGPDRLKITPAAVLFRADANYRSKIGVPQKRAKNVLGSIDYKNNVLTLVSFNMPADPAQELYMNNAWVLPQPQPYVGDVVNSYNDGPQNGKPGFGPFYEIESLSPAKELKTGEAMTHLHRTIHIQGDPALLAQLAKEILGVEWNDVRKEMLAK